MPIWDSAEADALWTAVCGKQRWEGELDRLEQDLKRVPAPDLWNMRTSARKDLIEYIRARLSRQVAGHGAPAEEVGEIEQILDPNALTLGFARRFATYKRPDLLLHDRDRLLRILTDKNRPVQLILAGKAHPQDGPGQEMIRQWIEFIRHTPARSHAVFLSDYDMRLAEHLIRGVDVWINTPRRPWEACGTSGMKVLVNGALNVSELDGWWAEAYSPEVGWAIGDGQEHGEDPRWDAADAEALYRVLEEKVVPEFYSRNADGIPLEWTNRMRESMARLTPQFSATRCIREYVEKHYVPLAGSYLSRASSGQGTVTGLLRWKEQVSRHWHKLRFGSMSIEGLNSEHHFSVQVHLDELDPDAVQVELYAEPLDGGCPVRQPMIRGKSLVGSQNAFTYSAAVPASRPAGDFTPRIIPYHADAFIPLEAAQILWYR
jgi:starch phosphorylase